MCVIIVGENKRPSEHMIAKAYAQNDHGAGIAYRVKVDGEDYVEWQKDLGLEELQKLVRDTPLPFIVHCRIASIGGIRGELTHPFEISTTAEPEVIGRTKNYVLFHNGHWDRWSDYMLTTAAKFGIPVPLGKYSDSRAMAWLAAVYSQGFLELLEKQKIVAFGPTDWNFFGDHWKLVDGILCSNDNFANRFVQGFTYPQQRASTGSGAGTEDCAHPGCIRRAGVFINNMRVCFEHIEFARNTVHKLEPCAFGNCKENAAWGDKYCHEHSQHLGKSAKDSAEVFEGKMVHLTPEKKGTPPKQERSPFEKLLHSGIKKNPQLVLKVAEREFEKGRKLSRISKNGLKRIRSAVEAQLWLDSKGFKDAQSALMQGQTQGLPS